MSIASITASHVSHSSISRYILFSINIFSSELKCHCSLSSPNRILSSSIKRFLVLSVFLFKISETPIKRGFSSDIIPEFGEMLVSQSVKAYKASIILSGEILGARWMIISTFAEVLSSTFFIFIFPLSLALRMLSINEPVVEPKGISVITSVFLSALLILALHRILPPRKPSL